MKKIVKIMAVVCLIVAMSVCVGYTFTTSVSPRVETAYAAVIRQGNSGAQVRTIQKKLKNWGYYKGSVDGIFGSKTKEAVKYFQRKNGLAVDGVVGPKTLAALGISGGNSSSSSNGSYSDADVQLLARLIYGEARGESYVGQVAVGAVVMNRIKSSSFPNTMSGVIYQSYAFTAVDDGQINLTPNATAKKAAQDAMNGWDPTYGALYYYNPATATSSWIFSRKTTVTIGNHVFAI
jgi:N-acetylmuramoyl-L-alanine amidase